MLNFKKNSWSGSHALSSQRRLKGEKCLHFQFFEPLMGAKNCERLEYFFFFNTRRNLSEMVKFVTIGQKVSSGQRKHS